mmetsp:Transcript_155921/g.276551  ORF Transcript_155921/g.276551 Transcript_155921/m.276551 type:complete len:331 (+) Transcript_155921:47-1039(+)
MKIACILCSVLLGLVTSVSEDLGVNDEVNLLQVVLDSHKQAYKPSRGTYKMEQRTLRYYSWVHVPKCGKILSSLIRLPGACNSEFNDDLIVNKKFQSLTNLASQDVPVPDINKNCPGIYTPYCHLSMGTIGMVADHSGIDNSMVQGHGIIMLRQPEQRIISAYQDSFHSWPTWYYQREPKSIAEYAKVVNGCAVKMLTRQGRACAHSNLYQEAPCGDPSHPARLEEAHMAIERLRSGFIFVGITEDWDMSVCLFHIMLGGKCHWSEFVNTNPGRSHANETFNTSLLDGFVDIYDGLLYEEAKRIYNENLKMYGVSPSTCESCFKHRASMN